MAYDLNTAKSKVSSYAQSKYGRGPQNDQEWGQIGQGIDLNNLDDNALNTAYGNVDRLAASYGAKPGPQAAPPPQNNPVTQTPNGPVSFQTGGGLQGVPPAQQTGAVPPSGPTGPNVPPNLQSIIPGLMQPKAPSPLDLQTQQAISDLMTRSQKPVSITDPELQPISDIHRVQNQRGAERMRSAAAERAAQTGTLESGGFDTEALGYEQDARFKNAAFDAGLVKEEMGARRGDLQKAIALAQQSGQFDKAQQLQQQLALMDAALRERFAGQDLDFRNRALGQQGRLGEGDLGLRLLQSLLQNDQYHTGLGADMGWKQALLNQDAISRLMGIL